MNKNLIKVGALMLGFTFSNDAFAISVTGKAKAIIKKAISATETQQMDFGTIAADATGGTVTMSAAGARSTSSGLTYYGASTNGLFTVQAEPSTALNVSFASGTLTGTPSGTMNLNNITSTSTPASNTTNGSGNLTLNVGADLIVGANQTSGSYNGTYGLTLSY